MTTYEINEKYCNLRKHELDEELIKIVFENPELRRKFKNPKKTQEICKLRLEGKTYKEIRELTNFSGSLIDHCHRVIRVYNEYLAKKKHEEWLTAKTANAQVFAHNAKLHDIDVELLAEEISKLPIWGIEDQEERNKTLLEWFYKEADEKEELI